MHRQPLLELLARYRSAFPNEADTVARIERLVRAHEDCLLRSCVPGHVTASAWIAAPDHTRFLLTHHRKLDRWLQLGGHVDGEPHVHLAALREAREESGMWQFEFVSADGSAASSSAANPLPFDLDVHVIPAREDEPQHEHHDVRFLLVARAGQELQISEESNDLRWFEPSQFASLATDASVRRLREKSAGFLHGR